MILRHLRIHQPPTDRPEWPVLHNGEVKSTKNSQGAAAEGSCKKKVKIWEAIYGREN